VTANTRGEADVSVIKIYKLFILKERAIYQHLNMLQNGETVAYGLVWVPKYFDIEKKLREQDLNGFSFEKEPGAPISPRNSTFLISVSLCLYFLLTFILIQVQSKDISC
jgi:hypothetical protein